MTKTICEERLEAWGYRLARDDERGPRLAYLEGSPLAYVARATAIDADRCGTEDDRDIAGVAPTLSEAYEHLCEVAACAAVWQEPAAEADREKPSPSRR